MNHLVSRLFRCLSGRATWQPRSVWAVLCLSVGFGVLSGCTTLLPPPKHMAIYDLGQPSAALLEASRLDAHWTPASIEVRVPSWLATAAMQYRLDYVPPADRRWFAESRWAAQPSEMVQRYLMQTLGYARASGNSTCRLRIEMEEFSQVFAAADNSAAVMNGTALILAQREERIVARRSFALQVAANSATAQGGVEAHRAMVQQFAQEMTDWLRQEQISGTGESSLHARCARVQRQ